MIKKAKLILFYQKGVVIPFFIIKGGSSIAILLFILTFSNAKFKANYLFSFLFNYTLCFLITLFIYRVADIIPNIKSYYFPSVLAYLAVILYLLGVNLLLYIFE